MYGRNFDWMECTSMVVKSKPEEGYASVSTVNLDFLNLGTEYDPEKPYLKSYRPQPCMPHGWD